MQPAQPVLSPSPRPRLCFLSYRHIREFALPVVAEFRDRADIEVVDGSFDSTLEIARTRMERGLVDVFVSAGSNASLLRTHLQAPVAVIQLGGFDILQALIQARRDASRVGIVTYGDTIPELEAVKALLKIEIHQYAYRTPDGARECIAALRSAQVPVVVGSSVVVEIAQQQGLRGILAYSLSSIRKGFEDALEFARAKRVEADRHSQVRAVLDSLQDAVLAVDAQDVLVAANPAMRRILGQPEQALLGQRLSQRYPPLSLQATLRSDQQEHDGVLHFQGRTWITHKTPIHGAGGASGAVLTLVDAQSIHEADNSLRRQQRHQQAAARYRFDDLVGAAPAFERAKALALTYARTDLNVWLAGESGVGKELFAQSIHNASPRARRPFVAVNCAAFPESLLESELFGYEEGAFTGSRRGGKRGLFEAAHTGTLFLDEIGDMPLTLQTRLLRVLQEREVTRLGATSAIPVDVRVIVATHQPLARWVAEGRFRQDLYYRINTLQVALPALRERRDDIARLATHCLAAILARGRPAALAAAAPAEAAAALVPLTPLLQQHTWPGNVRELENTMERYAVHLLNALGQPPAAVLAVFAASCPELFQAPWAGAAPPALAHSPRERALQALAHSGGNHAAAARQLGISRSTLWRWRQGAD